MLILKLKMVLFLPILLSQGILYLLLRERHQESKKNYAGGYLFCPKAGIYNWMFDEDLTSLYPSIIMTINIGKETLIGRIIDEDDRNNRLGLNDLKAMKDPNLKY
jgi:DNA polymerase elongation subunit (family B)